ncbi:hypothetical protein O3G_MSEX007281 [Manduca sexta]|uniref:Uncharacterized protein n=3 Tax=Manduca sexta TaxID=7130 RepID=A0A921Z658_MANSE|nr:hypothetical protein O3G_MSEX007281 [Manduca sexta]
MASDLGLHFYRMSIAWSRLLPNGFANKISEDGLNYYNNLIDGLLEKGIQPMVTLYHWDLPQRLQDLGGWTNPLIVDWFGDYARVVFSHFGDRVKSWITINEPSSICDIGHGSEIMAPGWQDPDNAVYLCNKYVLLSHAKAYRIYEAEFKAKYQGELSLANHLMWYEPFSPEDEELAETAREYIGGRYSHPVYSKEGGWPPVIEKVIAELSQKKGYKRSILPEFTKEEVEYIRGTFDFYAFNHYTSRLIRKAKEGEELGPFPLGDAPHINGKYEVHPDWKSTPSFWFYVYPEGIRQQLLWVRKQYGDIKIIITENGYSSETGLNDTERINYYRDYLKQVLLAIKEDGLNITGYTAWTLMDNFEWTDGYNSRFGLYEVDFTSPERTRTPKASAEFYKKLIQRHSLNFEL